MLPSPSTCSSEHQRHSWEEEDDGERQTCGSRATDAPPGPLWRCKRHGVGQHDIFISYRVRTEKTLAQVRAHGSSAFQLRRGLQERFSLLRLVQTRLPPFSSSPMESSVLVRGGDFPFVHGSNVIAPPCSSQLLAGKLETSRPRSPTVFLDKDCLVDGEDWQARSKALSRLYAT